MARIRTIKPEFPQSESMGNVSREARLTFILLWTIADDYGKLRGNSRMLASILFPYDADAGKLIDKWLDELEQQGCITRYAVDGTHYLKIEKWEDHQRVDRPTASKIADPPEGSRGIAKAREASCEDQGRDQGSRKGPDTRARVSLEELSVDHIRDWLAEQRAQGRYIHHDEHFVLDQFKNYCQSKGKKYADYIAGYRNAFEWDRCKPKLNGTGGSPTKVDRAKAAVVDALVELHAGHPG